MNTLGQQVSIDRARAGLTQEGLVKLLNNRRAREKPLIRQWLVNLEASTLRREIGQPMRKALASALLADEALYVSLPLRGDAKEIGGTARQERPPEFEALLAEVGHATKSVKITAVASPKGGVGRTLLVIHAALVQAIGCRWAGIEKSFPLLLDLDFHAPGVHTYPLYKAGEWGDSHDTPGNWRYRTFRQDELSQHDLVNVRLKNQRTGLVFLLHSITETPEFGESRTLLRQREGAEPDYESAITRLSDFLIRETGDSNSRYNLLRHIVATIDGDGIPRLALFPAGSPRHKEYDATVHALRWTELLGTGMGVVMINALLKAVTNVCKSEDHRRLLQQRIDHVWIDQGPGQSIATAVHQRLAESRIFVSSLVAQSSDTLEGWIENLSAAERAKTWVNLTFYRGRNVPIPSNNRNGDTLAYALIDQAVENFIEADNERAAVVKNLEQAGLARAHIVVADFQAEVVNKQLLRDPGSIYYNTVVRIVQAMNEEVFVPRESSISVTHELTEIKLLGEYVGNRDKPLEAPGGVLKAFQEWLTIRSQGARISGVALDHKQIVQLARGETLDLWFPTYRDERPIVHPETKCTNGHDTKQQVRLTDFDIAALPSYALDDAKGKELLIPFRTDKIRTSGVTTPDHNGPITEHYLAKNIRAWDETAVDGASGEIFGVPLFSHFPLIVANRKNLGDNLFKDAFKDLAQKRFASFLSYTDLRNAAIVGLRPEFKGCQLIMANESVPRVYEWLLVLGILGCVPFPEGLQDWAQIVDSFAEEAVFKTTLHYALLTYVAPAPKKEAVGWNEAMTRILHEEAGFAFVWPDAILEGYRNRDWQEFAYSAVPAERQLSETWLLTVPRKRHNSSSGHILWLLLLDFMTPESQAEYTEKGGIPVHLKVGSDPDIWRISPFTRVIGLLRQAGYGQSAFRIPRRAFNEARIVALGEALGELIKKFATFATPKSPAESMDWRAAIRIAQDPSDESRKSLFAFWKTTLQSIRNR